jgi:hypothetical protein
MLTHFKEKAHRGHLNLLYSLQVLIKRDKFTKNIPNVKAL